MAEMLTFSTRIINKHGTLEEWTLHEDVVLLPGEVAVVEVEKADAFLGKPPKSLLKIGDGTTPFSMLPYLTADAEDIYEWAKQELKPTYSTGEIVGFDQAVTDLISAQDLDTQYRLVQDDSHLADEHTLVIKLQKAPRDTEEFEDVEGSALTLQFYDDQLVMGRIQALEGKVGSSTVQTQISDQLETAKNALQDEIDKKQDILVFADDQSYPYTGSENHRAVTDGWVKNELEQAEETLNGSIDTKQDILSWAGVDGETGTEYRYTADSNPAVSQKFLEDAISAESESLKTGFEEDLQTARDDLNEAIINHGQEVTEALQEEIDQAVTESEAGMTAQMQTALEGVRSDLDTALQAKQDTLEWAGSEEGYGYDGYISKAVASDYLTRKIEDARGEISQEIDGDVKVLSDSVKTALDAKQDVLAFAGTIAYNPEVNRVVTQKYLESQVSGLSGAMSWFGTMDEVPEDNPDGIYKAGTVITVNGVEYAYNGSKWQELGDENKYSAQAPIWDQAAELAHIHANQAVLDAITVETYLGWNNMVNEANEYTDQQLAEQGIADLKENETDTYVIFDCGNAASLNAG